MCILNASFFRLSLTNEILAWFFFQPKKSWNSSWSSSRKLDDFLFRNFKFANGRKEKCFNPDDFISRFSLPFFSLFFFASGFSFTLVLLSTFLLMKKNTTLLPTHRCHWLTQIRVKRSLHNYHTTLKFGIINHYDLRRKYTSFILHR